MKNNPNSTMVSFRDSFRGYCKEDVNRYLFEMNKNFSLLEDDYRDEIATLKEKIKKLESEASAPSVDNSEAEALKMEIDSLKKENESLASSLLQKNQLIEELKKSPVVDDENIEKASLYDKMSNEIGNVFISANESAQTIISEANESAVKIKTAAANEAEAMKADASKRISETVDSVRNQIEELAKKYIEAYSLLSDELQSCVETVFNKSFSVADTKMSEAELKLENIKNEAETKISNEINKL